MRRSPLVKGLVVLGILWGVVWLGTSWAGGKAATADRVAELVEEAGFEDWSVEAGSLGEAERRGEKLEEIAKTLNRLDFRERDRLRESREVPEMFGRLSKEEKQRFVDLTLSESMARLMEAFDEMSPGERQKFAERAMRNLEQGLDREDFEALQGENPEIVQRIAKEGMRAFFEEASAETKMDLAPVLESFDSVMQGFVRPGMPAL